VLLSTLTQTTSVERLEAIHRHLNREGSGQGMLLTLLGFAAFALLLLVLNRLHTRSQAADMDRPGRLFRRMAQHLNLSLPQRGLLRRIASDLGLANPTVMLLGRRVFEARVQDWLASARAIKPDDRQRLEDLADHLFPRTQGLEARSTRSGEPPMPGAVT
jgi:hypothetical protein